VQIHAQWGWSTFDTTNSQIDSLYRSGGIEVSEVDGATHLVDNNFAVLRSGSQSALARCNDHELKLLSQTAPKRGDCVHAAKNNVLRLIC
jgi:PhoH-like ATPase